MSDAFGFLNKNPIEGALSGSTAINPPLTTPEGDDMGGRHAPKVIVKAAEPAPVEKSDLQLEYEASGNRLTKLQANRNLSDIPLNDKYFDELKHHRELYHKLQGK